MSVGGGTWPGEREGIAGERRWGRAGRGWRGAGEVAGMWLAPRQKERERGRWCPCLGTGLGTERVDGVFRDAARFAPARF